MRIGVVGAGVIGQLRAQSIKENPATQLAAVFDVSPHSAQTAVAGSSAPALTNLQQFLDTPMDAVVVSSPPHVHEEACVGSFERGRHVLCEKPLSNTLEGCQRLVDMAIAKKRVLAVGFNLRYYPAIKFVKDTIVSGRIGELDHLRVFGGHEGLPKFRIDWQYKFPESGGGAMMDVGIHMTDVARYLLDEITEVSGVMSENVWRVPGSEDNAVAVFRNPKGIPAIYQATWTEWKGYKFYVEAYGSKGMVRGAYAPMQNMIITQDRPGGARKTRWNLYPEIMVREKLKTWHSTALLSFKGELDDFLKMTRGNTHVPLADGYAGLRSVEVARAVKQSSETHQVVKMKALGRMEPV
ncbi:MAG TPA: Gfo/Idh/MocA family oxidoreductase [Polyangiales bacterium]|nr:Gfo/Idh/MocA family oxidoreductase [Polyangiales bacterium]